MNYLRSKLRNMRLIGIDYGKKRIGIAFSASDFVSPLEVLTVRNTDEAIARICFLSANEQADAVVFGVPLNQSGEPTMESLEVKDFCRRLAPLLRIPIKFQDEAFSSREALKTAIEAGVSQESRRALDNLAACEILRRYIEEHKT